MAPTSIFLFPDDDSEYSSEARDMPSPNEVPRSLLVEEPSKTEMFPSFFEHLPEPVNDGVFGQSTKERMPEPTKVIKGFDDGLKEQPKEEIADSKTLLRPTYPPPSNQAYWLTSDGHDPKYAYDKSRVAQEENRRRESLSEVQRKRRESLLNAHARTPTPTRARTNTDNKITASSPEPSTEGQKIAATIDWNRPAWKPTVHGAVDFYSAEEQRADFIRSIDDYAKTSLQGSRFRFHRDQPHLLIPPKIDRTHPPEYFYEYCKKCDENHIPPGPPITLPDRDTCGAFLPDWFPCHLYQKPWETFRQLYNKIVLCEEQERGFRVNAIHDPTKPVWDYEYHEDEPKWRAMGLYPGWRKCRTGEKATEAERTCELCIKPKPEVESVATEGENAGSVSDQRRYLENWVEGMMNVVGIQDKAVAREMIHRMKPQEVLSHFAEYRVPSHELEGYDTCDDSDPDGEKTIMPSPPKLKPLIPLIASASTLDLGENGLKYELESLSLQRTPTASSSSSDGLVMRPSKSFFAK